MADYSLDDYIQKKGPRLGGRLGNRLGGKISPGKAAVATHQRQNKSVGIKNRIGGQQKPVVVTGLGKIKGGFDARQKLNQKSNIHVQDAREKLVQKSKFADARMKIQNKKAQTTGPTNLKTVTSPNDMRIKINNAKAKKTDARQMIKARQQAKSPGAGQGPTTGLGNVKSASLARQGASGYVKLGASGSLTRTIPGGQGVQAGANIFSKTIQNQRASTAQNRSNLIDVRISNNDQVSQHSMQQMYPSSPPPPVVHTAMTGMMPYVQVHNDMYQAPVAPVSQYGQPAYLQEDYYQQVYTPPAPVLVSQPQPPIRITASQAPLRAPKPKVKVRTAKPVMVQQPEEEDRDMGVLDNISPLQGFRVIVSNLHHSVTQEDVVELFGVVGPLKKVKLLKAGMAEVVFVRKEDATGSIRKYHMRELDGQPMHVTMGSSVSSPAPAKVTPISQTHQPLKLNTMNSKSPAETTVDPQLIHRALFKTTSKEDPPARPVTFTVKI